jgi:Predicted dehydrogenases and related proteins
VVALGRHSGMAETALHLLERGVPFMMEKPMGLHAGEVSRIADKAAAQKAFVAVAFPQRYSPFVARARQMIAEGSFGTLSHLYFRLNRPTSARYPAWDSPWMLDPAQAGGGCLRNLGSHVFDLFLLLTGEEATVTGAQLSARALGQRVEDFASVLLRSTSGVLGTVEIGNTVPYAGSDSEWKMAGRTRSSCMTTTTRCGSSPREARRRSPRRPPRHCIRRRCVTSSTTGGAACPRP